MGGMPGAHEGEEAVIAQGQPEGVQGGGAAGVAAVVEDTVRAGVGDAQVSPVAVVEGVPFGAGDGVGGIFADVFGPQPFAVGGKTLIEPDVAPVAQADAV